MAPWRRQRPWPRIFPAWGLRPPSGGGKNIFPVRAPSRDTTGRMRLLKKTLVVVAGVYALLCVLLYFEQSKFIFVPQREVQFTPKDFGCEFSEIDFGPSGQLHGWWLSG